MEDQEKVAEGRDREERAHAQVGSEAYYRLIRFIRKNTNFKDLKAAVHLLGIVSDALRAVQRDLEKMKDGGGE